MIRLALRSVRARWGRVVLTALAIVASTAFLSGTFIFRDTVQRTFNALFADVFERVDAYVQSSNSVEGFLGFERRDRLPADVVDEVRGVAGVADAQAFVQGDAVVIDKEGKPIERPTAPTFGATVNSGPLSVWRIAKGRLPNGPTEVALDTITAADAGYVVGDTVKVNAEGGSRDFTLVGITVYDNIVSPGNATWALFDARTAEEFVAKPGFVDAVLVKGDGSLPDDVLVTRVQAALDPNIAETLTSAEITKQTQTDIERSLGFITLFLAIFSFIALGVGMFVIYNVFSITAAQRQRENALLRAIGASRRQVTWTLLIESAVIGLLGSIAGLFGGIGLALGIRNLLDALDYSIPARGLALEPFTVVLTIVSGTAASLIAAIAPAIGAGRVPPVAAMADTAFERTGSVRGRAIGAAGCAVLGVATIAAVLIGADGIFLAVGIALLFAAVLLIGPVMARPIARLLGAPIQRWRGVTGAMARGNVQRNPKRTARTAAPVLIGVALVTGASVFAASIKVQLRETIGSTFVGDYVINTSNGGALSFSQTFIDDLNTLPEVGSATGLGFVPIADAKGERAGGATINPLTANGLLKFDFLQGSLASLTPQGMLVSDGEAKRKHLSVGDEFDVRIDGAVRALIVQGIYATADFIPARTYHRDTFAGTSLSNTAGFVSLTRSPNVSDSAFRAAVDRAITRYGIGELQDRNQFIDSRANLVDQSLAFVYGLLALSIVIAVFGIVLTLLLAVYERRRETGLLRAVGMTRTQVRTTVRWESVLTSVYGAVVGVVMGLVLGYVVIAALRDQGLDKYSVPVTTIAAILVIAFVVGVIAAVVPAWRATKLDILQAIATE
ncbi:MAG TPA: FtsX-like permease family protein [Ilumatobacteraceae bacterium]